MKETIKISLKEEIDKEVKQIEKELSEHPELDNINVTEEMDHALLAKIRAYEQEKEEEDAARREYEKKYSVKSSDVEMSEELFPDISALKPTDERSNVQELPKKMYKKKRKKKIIAALVAVFVLVAGMSVTSIGSKSYLKVLIEKITGRAPVEVMNVEDMDSQETEDSEELEAYQECKNMLKGDIVKIGYRPEGFEFEKSEIDKVTQQAQIFYKHGNEVIRYRIYLNSTDSSWGSTEEDEKIREYNINVNDIDVQVEEYRAQNKKERRFDARFQYKGICYQFKGEMKETEFIEIIKNLYFF